jgi:hypothetical protein
MLRSLPNDCAAVGFVPFAPNALQQMRTKLNYLVGARVQRWRQSNCRAP